MHRGLVEPGIPLTPSHEGRGRAGVGGSAGTNPVPIESHCRKRAKAVPSDAR